MNLNEYKILSVIKNTKRSLFFRDISKTSGVSIGGTQQVLKKYSNFIEKKEEGRNTYYFFKNNFETSYLKKIIEFNKSMRFFLENPLLKEFFGFFTRNQIPCLVFGSYARGKHTKNSDLDIIVLSDKKIPRHLCPVKIHLINLSKKQFEFSLKNKEPLIKEIEKDYIIINGIEYFENVLGEENE